MKKILSMFLAVVLLAGALSIQAGAALKPVYAVDENNKPTDVIDYKATVNQYLDSANVFKKDEDKLAKMTLKYEKNGYQLWADEFTGEVATVNLATGQTMFTNPIDVASSDAAYSNTTRYELMSQLIVKYTDNGTEKLFNSFDQAAMNGQIDVKNIKNGLRVEYTIGREDTKYLVPRLIEKERFETNILNVVAAEVAETAGATIEEVKSNPYQAKFFEYTKVVSFYTLKDPNTVKTDRELSEMQSQFEITKKDYKGQLMAVYICSAVSGQELRQVESRIKKYCPLYTFEQLDYDHELTEYSKGDRAPALFKMALEYRLDEFGLTVRLPANGIRFNEAEYQLSDITVLPWMGAGSKTDTGYTFFPDGSGAIFRFEDLNDGKTHTISGNIYGQDYAYHTITGTHQEIIRYPVFGIVQNKELKEEVTEDELGTETGTEAGTDTEAGTKEGTEPGEDVGEDTEAVEENKNDIMSSGFVAILEEGDALAKLTLKHYGAVSKYNTVHIVVNPRPRDQYILSDAVSVGGNNSVTVVSKRKYVGDYKIRYIMLSDKELAAEKGIENFYEATWLGMAMAYRAYLTSPFSTGTQHLPEEEQYHVLTPLSDDEVKENIPLYIETFGSVKTIKKVLSIPVNTKVALTSFENIQEMYTQLKDVNIDNVNFKLTGYYNGGMYSAVPYKLDFEKSAGGKKGFEKLVADARDRGYGVYLDFDFAYATSSAAKAFDGLNNDRDLVKAIDDRYTSKQYYSVTRQSYTSYFELAISPSRFTHFYDKVSEEYLSYNPIGISLSTVASDLNSDFDEDEPYNREDSKQFTIDLFKKIDKDYNSVMADSANAYTWAYIDHMVNAAVDSSRYVKASNSVPFLGVVLHGYIQFAGTPMNMEGNIGYAMLKAIENGSGLYFILSYDNTELLKKDVQLSQYYSVRYDIWFDELVERYNTVNDVLKDLQTKPIINHEFLIGERVPDADELESDKIAAEEAAKAEEAARLEAERIARINQIREGRFNALANTIKNIDMAKTIIANYMDVIDEENPENNKLGMISTLAEALAAIQATDFLERYAKSTASVEANELNVKNVKKEMEEAKKAYDDFVDEVGTEPALDADQTKLADLKKAYDKAKSKLESAEVDLKDAKDGLKLLEKNELYVALGAAHSKFQGGLGEFDKYLAKLDTDLANMQVAYDELTDPTKDYSQPLVEDIKAKYAELQAKAEELRGIINDAKALYMQYYEAVLEYYPGQDYITKVEKPKEDNKDDDSYVYTKYTNDDGNIVAVTYGGKNGNINEAFKTFILNYNFFEVTTNYNGTDYTIPAFGYVIIEN